MTLKEFAALFHLSVNELCELTGFTRQGLNEMVKGNSAKDSEKKRKVRWKLKELSEEMAYIKRRELLDEHRERINAIENVFGRL